MLLIVLWYCHKRGREERLEKERLSREASASNLDSTVGPTEAPIITSAENAPIGNVESKGKEAQRAPAAVPTSPARTGPVASLPPSVGKKTRRQTVEPYEGT